MGVYKTGRSVNGPSKANGERDDRDGGMKTAIWIIAWHDLSGDADRDVTQVALSAEEAVAAVRRILHGETVFEEIYDPEHDTFSPGEDRVRVLVRGG